MNEGTDYRAKRTLAGELGISLLALNRRIQRASDRFPELAPRELPGLVHRGDLLALLDAVANTRRRRRRALALNGEQGDTNE